MSLIPKGNSLRQLLGPSRFSLEGFLGTDARNPDEIIEEDLKTLQRLGVSKEKIATALRDVYVKAERALGNRIQIAEKVIAVHQEARGRIPSPFPGDGTFQKGQAQLSDATSGQLLVVTPLSIHLIEKHGFFQGKGSKYRIEPEAAAILINKLL